MCCAPAAPRAQRASEGRGACRAGTCTRRLRVGSAEADGCFNTGGLTMNAAAIRTPAARTPRALHGSSSCFSVKMGSPVSGNVRFSTTSFIVHFSPIPDPSGTHKGREKDVVWTGFFVPTLLRMYIKYIIHNHLRTIAICNENFFLLHALPASTRLTSNCETNPLLPPLRVLRALYVQNKAILFYFLSPSPRGDERSEESRGHGRRPTTDRASVNLDRRGAWSRPASCPFARTVDRAPPRTLAFARKGHRD